MFLKNNRRSFVVSIASTHPRPRSRHPDAPSNGLIEAIPAPASPIRRGNLKLSRRGALPLNAATPESLS